MRSCLILLMIPGIWMSTLLPAAVPEIPYQRPSESISSIIERSWPPLYNVDPSKRWLLEIEAAPLPSVSTLARDEVHLAGFRIYEDTRARSRRIHTDRMVLVAISSGERREVKGLAENPVILFVKWSPDGNSIAVLVESTKKVELWMIDAEEAFGRKLSDVAIHAGMEHMIAWAGDSKSVWVKTIPENQGLPPVPPAFPETVLVRETEGNPVPAQTHQGLLRSGLDIDRFKYYLTSQLTQVFLDGTHRNLGRPDLFRYFRNSPDDRYLLVEILTEPWSYFVNEDQFACAYSVFDTESGDQQFIAKAPLAESVPYSGGWVRTGARKLDWRSDLPATLVWLEALDQGNPYNKEKYRDRIVSLSAPFTGAVREVLVSKYRIADIIWHLQEQALLVSWDWTGREVFLSSFNPQSSEGSARKLISYTMGDRYRHPGIPLITHNTAGFPVAETDSSSESIYLVGEGSSPDGDRPFLDSLDLDNKRKRRIFRSKEPFFELPVLLMDSQKDEVLIMRESPNSPPNFFRVSKEGEEEVRLTSNDNRYPEFVGVQRILLKYKRSDRLDLTANLYLPSGYDIQRDGPLPTLVWAYPKAYLSAENASQIKRSPFQYIFPKWNQPLLWISKGFAVVDDPAMPILSKGRSSPNDSFVPQLVDSAKALVDELVKQGVSEEGRIVLGGHSYGAFMTANLLAHSDLFCAGIARSGAYNRTLTPFGFQSEERNLWEASKTYLSMSPFLFANGINEPLLLFHGEKDDNPATYPIQSERLFHALQGLGGQARLVVFPNEGHTFRGKETILHYLWEMEQWLNLHVKQQTPLEELPGGLNRNYADSSIKRSTDATSGERTD